MAKPKKNPEPENVKYEGKEVDPSLEAKVDSYMSSDLKAEAPKSKDKKSVNITFADEEPIEPTEGAPLLPTDELPDIAKPNAKASKKITITESAEEDNSIPETPGDTPALPAGDQVEEEIPTLSEEDDASADKKEPSLEDESEVEDDSLLDEIGDDLEPIEPSIESEAEDESTEDIPAEPEQPKTDPLPKLRPEPIPMADVPVKDELGLTDSKTSKVVEDIIASEADELLDLDVDEPHAKAPILAQPNGKSKPKRKNIFARMWRAKRARNAIIIVVFLAVAVVAIVPTTRYTALNTIGVRASTSVKVLDNKTNQPLKSVDVIIGSLKSKTDKNGIAKVENIKLGPQTVLIRKAGFADITRPMTIGWGSNPQEEAKLVATGTQYTFNLTDFLSGKGVKGAEVTSGEASAQADEKGEAVLTLPHNEVDEVDIKVQAEDYRVESLKVPYQNKATTKVQLVPAKKHVFISKRSGKYDVYKIDADGKNEEKVLAGSGYEREDGMSLISNPSKDYAALISTREGLRNQDGFLLSTLTLINLSNNATTKLAQSEKIQVIDWVGSKIIYIKIAQGASAENLQRHRLISHDVSTNTDVELASTNYFNDVVAANGAIYYSPALYKVNGQVGLYKINPDGSGKRTIYEKEVWNLFRSSYDKISVSVGQDWYDLNLSNDAFSKAPGPPSVLKTRIYTESPDKSRSLWTDERDGKGVLLAYSISTREDKVLQTQNGIKNPINWLDNTHAVYRVVSASETADYVISINGGEPKKIRDVTNAAGIDRWYYY